jgi:hypothetical protein
MEQSIDTNKPNRRFSMLNPVRFGGVYLKQASVQEGGIGEYTTNVTISVTNDANGNDLDKYASIVGPPSFQSSVLSPYSLKGEQVFEYIYDSNPSVGGSYFSAGEGTRIANTPENKRLVLELFKELKGLYPPIKDEMENSAKNYFSA